MPQANNKYRNLVLPAILVMALLALAVLQIVWLKDLSEGQRERMQENVEIGAGRLAEELTEILQSTHNEFQFVGRPGDSLNTLLRSADRIWTEWRGNTEFPGLIESILVRNNTQDSAKIVALNASGDAMLISADNRKGAHNLLRRNDGKTPLELIPNLSTVFEDESAMLVNVIDPMSLASDGALRVAQTQRNQEFTSVTASSVVRINNIANRSTEIHLRYTDPVKVVLVIDRAYLKDKVIPALTAKHLMYDGSLDYNIAIARIDSTEKRVFYGELGLNESLERADVVIPITHPKEVSFFVMNTGANILIRNRAAQVSVPALRDSVRRSFSYSFSTSESVDSSTQPPIAFAQAGFQANLQPAWSVYVRHNLGSIDAAANRFRRNTSLLSLGIMSILAIGFVLIFRNNSKANELARQQMEFVAGVSHELRTPLSVIRSAGDNMTAGLIKDEDGARRYGKLIHSESVRLNDLIEQVLEFSGIQSGQRRYEYKPEQTHRLVLHSLKGLGERVDPEKVSINVSFEPCPQIMADTSGLISVIQNLVINAVKYNGDDPIVNIKVYNKYAAGKQGVCIDFEDNGHGIHQDELDKIFEPFYRARGVRDQQIKGNGLGLSIVKSIMQQHDGSISVSSKLGVGSTFTLSFNWLHQELQNSGSR